MSQVRGKKKTSHTEISFPVSLHGEKIFSSVKNNHKTFSLCQKILDVWSYLALFKLSMSGFGPCQMVLERTRHQGPFDVDQCLMNILDGTKFNIWSNILVWTQFFLDILDRTKYSAEGYIASEILLYIHSISKN